MDKIKKEKFGKFYYAPYKGNLNTPMRPFSNYTSLVDYPYYYYYEDRPYFQSEFRTCHKKIYDTNYPPVLNKKILLDDGSTIEAFNADGSNGLFLCACFILIVVLYYYRKK